MVPGEDGPGQVLEAPRTGTAVIALTVGLHLVLAVLDDILRVAMRAGDPVGPTEVSDGLEALGVVDEVRKVDPALSPSVNEAEQCKHAEE